MKTKTIVNFLFFLLLTATLSAELPDFISVAKKAMPAVVSIQIKRSPSLEGADSERIFSEGSGFFISADGYILTNSHVVDKAVEILVVLNTGATHTATLIGQDRNTDVALVKIEGHDFPYLEFAEKNDLQVGQWVAAIGNPFGFQASLTSGIISALGRNNKGVLRVEDFIQIDVKICPGNSGGPLLNLDSKVIGMNTIIFNHPETKLCISFAIPGAIIEHSFNRLKQDGIVTYGHIGISSQRIDKALAEAFEGASIDDIVITKVDPDSAAEKAGLQRGDILLSYDGNRIHGIGTFQNNISFMTPGTIVELSVLREGEIIAIPFEVGLYTDYKTLILSSFKLGFVFNETPDGIEVTAVDPKSPAKLAGLCNETLILSINHRPVYTLKEMYEALSLTKPGKPALFFVKIDSETGYMSIKVD